MGLMAECGIILAAWTGILQSPLYIGIPEAIKSVLAIYQSQIGADKLFPKTVGFEMNIEDKLIVIQILDCWMRLTSIRLC